MEIEETPLLPAYTRDAYDWWWGTDSPGAYPADVRVTAYDKDFRVRAQYFHVSSLVEHVEVANAYLQLVKATHRGDT